jgi:hypothetical protein
VIGCVCDLSLLQILGRIRTDCSKPSFDVDLFNALLALALVLSSMRLIVALVRFQGVCLGNGSSCVTWGFPSEVRSIGFGVVVRNDDSGNREYLDLLP